MQVGERVGGFNYLNLLWSFVMSSPDEANNLPAFNPPRIRYGDTPPAQRIDRSAEADELLKLSNYPGE